MLPEIFRSIFHSIVSVPVFSLVFHTDIPLLPVVGPSTSPGGISFVIHWLNNKELNFTSEAEKLLEEMSKKTGASSEEQDSATEQGDTQTNSDEDVEATPAPPIPEMDINTGLAGEN